MVFTESSLSIHVPGTDLDCHPEIMISRLSLATFLSALIFIVYSANHGSLPAIISLHERLPFGDTLGHFILAGTLSFLAVIALQAKAVHFANLCLPLGSVIVLPIVVIEEMSQMLIPNRSFSLLDMSANICGVLFFGWLAMQLFSNQTGRAIRRNNRAY